MEYYILSLKYSMKDRTQPMLIWWRPNCAGYTIDLNQAGRYTEEQVQKESSYLNNADTTFAVPCDMVDNGQPFRCVESGSTLAGDIFKLKRLGVIHGGRKSNRKNKADEARVAVSSQP